MEVFDSATINSLDDSRPSSDHYIASFPAAVAVSALGTGYFSTVGGIFRETKMPRYASKYKQVTGLWILGFVTNLQLLFPIKLR